MCVWKELTLNIQRQLEFDMGRNRHRCRPEELCVTQEQLNEKQHI